MSNKVEKFLPKSSAIKQRFPDGDIIQLDMIDGWDDLSSDQQLYIIEFLESFPKKLQPAIRAGISTGTYYKWTKEDKNFVSVLETIKSLYSESLHFIHFEEAKGNSKIRASELRALEADGWQKEGSKSIPKNQQNNFFVGEGGGLKKLVKLLEKNNIEDAEIVDD